MLGTSLLLTYAGPIVLANHGQSGKPCLVTDPSADSITLLWSVLLVSMLIYQGAPAGQSARNRAMLGNF